MPTRLLLSYSAPGYELLRNIYLSCEVWLVAGGAVCVGFGRSEQVMRAYLVSIHFLAVLYSYTHGPFCTLTTACEQLYFLGVQLPKVFRADTLCPYEPQSVPLLHMLMAV